MTAPTIGSLFAGVLPKQATAALRHLIGEATS